MYIWLLFRVQSVQIHTCMYAYNIIVRTYMLPGQGAVLRRDVSSSSSSSACVFSSEFVADVEIPAVDESKPSTTVQVRTSQVPTHTYKYECISSYNYLCIHTFILS